MEEEGQQTVTPPNPQRLIAKLEDFKLGGGKIVPWIETLDITSVEPLLITDAQDDLEREAAFYKQALDAANEAIRRFTDLKIPHTRPEDFFAEMAKSDDHMKKIRSRMLQEKDNIVKSAERRRQRENKKYGKQVQSQKIQERAKKKRTEMELIKKWRKERAQNKSSGSITNEEFPLELIAEQERQEQSRKRKRPKLSESKKKKQKYGFGGKKRGQKRNTSESSADVSGYSLARIKAPFPGQRPHHAPKAQKKMQKRIRKQRRTK